MSFTKGEHLRVSFGVVLRESSWLTDLGFGSATRAHTQVNPCSYSVNFRDIHMAYFRVDTGARPFVCRQCKRSFSRQDSLMRHERIHTRKATSTINSASPNIESHPITPESLGSIENATSHGQVSSSPRAEAEEWHQDPAAIPDLSAQSGELNLDLIWPDSEDLFQTIMSVDSTRQHPVAAMTFPFDIVPQPSIGPSISSGSLADPISAIPSGGNQRAVQDLSKMISALVRSISSIIPKTSL